MTRLCHKNADLKAEVDQMQKNEADNERLIGTWEALDRIKNIFQRPYSLEADASYLHIPVVASR